jgi:hypothetical protein
MLTRARNLFSLASMRIHILAAPLLALAACDSAPTQNNVVDVASNNMIADDVTAVDDDSASAPSEPATSEPATPPANQALTASEEEDEARNKADLGIE